MSMFCGGKGGEGGEGPAEHANLCRQGMQSGMQSDNGSDQIEGSRIRSLEQSDRMLGSTRASVIDELFEQRGRGGLLRGHDSAFGTCNDQRAGAASSDEAAAAAVAAGVTAAAVA